MSDKRTRLTDMEFDEISFVDNPAHPDAKVVLFKRHEPDEMEKALHPGSHNSGPVSSDVHVDRPLGSDKRRKRKRKKKQDEVEEMMEKGSGDPSLYGSGSTKKKKRKKRVSFDKHAATHNEKTHGNWARGIASASKPNPVKARGQALAEGGKFEELEAFRLAQGRGEESKQGGGRLTVKRDVRQQPGPRRQGFRSGGDPAKDFARLERLIRAQMAGRSESQIQRKITRMRRAEAGKGSGGIMAVRARTRTRAITKEVEPMDELYEAVHQFDDEEMRKGLVTAGAPMLDLNNLWEYARGGEKPNTGVSSGGETTDGGKEAGSRGHSSPRSDGSPTSASVVPSRLNETMAVGNPGTASHDLIREGRAGRQGNVQGGTVSTQELMNQWGLSKVYQETNAAGGDG